MDDKKIENLLNTTYEILLKQNKNIKKSEKELGELEETLSGNDENFFILRGLDEVMAIALQEEKKKYFFKYINDFIWVHGLSDGTKEYTLEKMKENCSEETETIVGNSKYNESSAESRKLGKEMRESFSDEENRIFEIYSDVSTDIESIKSHLFFEAMLQTGAFLKKIEEVTEV